MVAVVAVRAGRSPAAPASRGDSRRLSEAVSKCFVGVGAASNREELFQQPLCCTSFVSEAGRERESEREGGGSSRYQEASGEQQYLPARDLQQIRQAVEAAQGLET